MAHRFQLMAGGWQDYPEEVSNQIKESFLRGDDQCEINVPVERSRSHTMGSFWKLGFRH